RRRVRLCPRSHPGQDLGSTLGLVRELWNIRAAPLPLDEALGGQELEVGFNLLLKRSIAVSLKSGCDLAFEMLSREEEQLLQTRLANDWLVFLVGATRLTEEDE